MEKKINDNLGLDDSGMTGLVILRDGKTNKIIFQKHNMILKSGKEYVAYRILSPDTAVLGTLIPNDLENKGYNSYRLGKIAFGYNSKEVDYSDTAITTIKDTDGSSDLFVFPITTTATSSGVEAEYIAGSDGAPYLKFTINFLGKNIIGTDNSDYICELGIYLTKDGSTVTNLSKSDILFSRIRFDKIPISADSEYSLTYYIYF